MTLQGLVKYFVDVDSAKAHCWLGSYSLMIHCKFSMMNFNYF